MARPGITRLRPTSRLAGLACLLFLLWLGSANYNNNLGFLLTYLLASSAFVSLFQTRLQLQGLEVHVTSPKGVFAGNTVSLTVRVRNTTSRSKPFLRVWIPGGSPVPLSLAPHQTRQVSIPLKAEVRGVWALRPILMDSTFPLGLFRAVVQIPDGPKVTVYPKPVDGCPAIRRSFTRSGEESLDFAGFRDYQGGDSLRQIHWKGLAKGLGLKVRDDKPAPVLDDWYLDWNSLPPASVEHRLQWLCHGVLEAARNGEPYGLRLPTQVISPAHGESHLHECLSLLAEFPHARPH